MEKAFDTDIEDFEVTTMTNIEDEDPEGKIKTSTGNDNILLGKSIYSFPNLGKMSSELCFYVFTFTTTLSIR